jgi:RNA polymerase sigma-70 factor (ECF subfamily)
MDEAKNQGFLALFLRDEPRLYAVIRSMVFNDADADEILQEIATDMWRKFDQFAPGTSFERWANAFVRHKVLDYQRRRRTHGAASLSDRMLELLVDRSDATSDSHHRTLAALEQCVDKLPEPDRRLLAHRYQPGQTNRSVAQASGRSESVVSRSLNRIYTLLLECIERTRERGA